MRKYAGYSGLAPDFRLRIRHRFLQTSHTMSHTWVPGGLPRFRGAKIRGGARECYHIEIERVIELADEACDHLWAATVSPRKGPDGMVHLF